MPGNSSCGDPWVYEQLYVEEEKQAIDKEKMEVATLRNELLEARVRQHEEEIIRLANPTVKDAWEQYQTVLKLAKK